MFTGLFNHHQNWILEHCCLPWKQFNAHCIHSPASFPPIRRHSSAVCFYEFTSFGHFIQWHHTTHNLWPLACFTSQCFPGLPLWRFSVLHPIAWYSVVGAPPRRPTRVWAPDWGTAGCFPSAVWAIMLPTFTDTLLGGRMLHFSRVDAQEYSCGVTGKC